MKKIIILASALVLGGTAYAQDASMQPPSSGSTMPSAPDASMPSATTPDASMPAGSAPAGAMPSGGTSDSSSMPASGGTQDGSSMSGGGQAASATDDSNLPTCSKSVTDKCKQGSGGTAHHRPMRHKK